MTLEETLEKIHPANQAAMAASLEHWSNIAMPLHSLGRLQGHRRSYRRHDGRSAVDLKKKHWWLCVPITVWWKKA